MEKFVSILNARRCKDILNKNEKDERLSVALVLIIPILSCRFLLRPSSILGYERPVFGDITLGSRELNFHCH